MTPARGGVGCAIGVAILLCAAAAARASEESQALSARGLIALQAGNTQDALALFDRAVAADPNDPEVRYQRGVTRAKLGDYTGAIEDQRAALAARPDFPEAALELGVALTEAGDYEEAAHWLQVAQYDPALDAQASFFLGLSQLRLDQLDAAQRNFQRARTRDPSLVVSAQYYEGVVAYRRHDLDAAEALFAAVEQAQPNSATGREASLFLARITQSRRAAWSAFGNVALEYDSNVTLGPSSSTVAQGITGEGDGRFVINAGGRYVPWTYGPASLSLSYEFFQSVQFHLSDFDLQDHRPAVQLSLDFDRVFFGFLGRYDYYLLQTDSFLQEPTAFAWAALREDGIGRTEVYYRMQWRDYKKEFIGNPPPQPTPTPGQPTATSEGFEQLNGFYNFVGVRQFINLGSTDRELWFGYQMAFNDMDNGGSDIYRYGAQQFEVALRWLLPYAVTAEAGYRYEHQDYAEVSALINPDREVRADNDHRIIVAFERPLPEVYDHLFLNAAWYGTFNNSNNVLFEYTRQIGSIGAEVRF